MFKVKKLRESLIAKIIAWVLCVASVLGAAALGICLFAGVSENWFGKTRSEALKNAYEHVNAIYSRQTFDEIGNNFWGRAMRENYFQYGVVKSDSLSGVNLRDSRSYLDTNMTDEELANLDLDSLFLYQMSQDENGSRDGFRMGYYGNYEDLSELDITAGDLYSDSGWSYHYADMICYDAAEGILYYRADGNFYPVQNVSLCYSNSEEATIYSYQYDFTQTKYRLVGKSAADGVEWTDAYTDEFASADVEMADESAEPVILEQDTDTAQAVVTDEIIKILEGNGVGSIVNFVELKNTAFDYDTWGTILLDGIRSLRGDELVLIDSTDMAKDSFIGTDGYYLNENYTLVVRKEVHWDTYFIVSIVPDLVPEDQVGSLYTQESWLVNLYYDLADRNLFQGFGISIFVMLLSFGFLIYAAGHRRAAEGIVLTSIDRIPIEIISIIVGIAEFGLLFLGIFIIEKTGLDKSAYDCIGLCGLLGGIMTVIAVVYMLSLCVRVKAGKWWRNSVCYWIYSKIRDMAVNIFRHLHMLWKIVAIMVFILFVEILVVVNCYSDVSALFLLLKDLVLCSILCVLAMQMVELQKASQYMAEGNLSYKINTDKMFWECKKHGENLNKISEGMSKAVNERMKSEHLKTELITNVSHDIKTPLTSIINYVDLLSKEELHNEKAAGYLEVLDRQSSKLKKLIEDLVEASKASSGNLAVDKQQLEAGVFLTQTVGEYEEKLSLAGLELIASKPEEPVYIMADGRHVWRVIDNLMNNICKYAQTGSRVYVNLERNDKNVRILFRNISKYPLNISGDELMERFVRGDQSRNTEGHGLGLSIAQSLMRMIDGDMEIVVDGDLFKVVLVFDRVLPKIPELYLEKTGS